MFTVPFFLPSMGALQWDTGRG
uniref:Uncharacterized protein n=1 Tax=Arundo donax TaxID=35708 RepID=A0A0A9H0A1_ARUDO